jgi:NADH dehydrogenase
VRTGSDRTPIAAQVTEFHSGSVTDPAGIQGACDGCQAVIHLVGIIHEGRDSFEDVHVAGTQNMLAEARRAGTRRFIYLSGLGSRTEAPARYHRTKAIAERCVRESGMEDYIFPASVIFGPEDAFLNQFIGMAQSWFNPPWPLMPVPGGGRGYLQPVWVEDVAEVLVKALGDAPPFPPGTYELGGPEALTLRRIMEMARGAAGQRRLLVPVPVCLLKPVAWFFEKTMRNPPLTRDQLLMMGEDGRPKANRTQEWLGREPQRLQTYLRDRFG